MCYNGKTNSIYNENIKINQPNEDGIIEQFDGYFSLEDTSVDTVRSRLLDEKEYWGGAYGVASQTQVIKQADVIAMMSIFKDEYTKEQMQKNYLKGLIFRLLQKQHFHKSP